MSRAVWKGLVINKNCRKKNVWFRTNIILNYMVGFTFFVHTGRFLKRLFITRKMVGYKFGEFIRTRKYGKSKIRINNVNRLKKKV